MKILITGANGELGSDLTKLLATKGYRVYATYRSTKKEKLLKSKNLKWFKHDFSLNLFKKKKIDILINCIAAHSYSKKKKISDLVNSNIIALKNIVEYADKNKIKLILNLSTISVYGDIDIKKLNEDYIPKKQNNLGLTKFCGEILLFNGLTNFLNLRLPGVLTTSANQSRPWLKTIIAKIKKNKPIKIYNYKKKFNNLIDSYEIFRFVNFLLEKKLFKQSIRTTYNLASTKPLPMIKIIELVKKYYLSKSKIMIKKSYMRSYTINTEKIYQKFKFLPSTTENIIKRNLL